MAHDFLLEGCMIGRKANKSDKKALQFKWGKNASKNSVKATTKYKAMKSAERGKNALLLLFLQSSQAVATQHASCPCAAVSKGGRASRGRERAFTFRT